METKIRLMIDPIAYTSKPSGDDCGAIKNRAKSNEVTLYELITAIENGQTIIPALMNGTKAADWTEQQLFMVDIDNSVENTKIITPEIAIDICKNNDIRPIFYYHTFSHSEENNPKFRLIFLMGEIVRDINKRNLIVEILTNLFAQADKSCQNADRLFFGTNKKVVVIDENARINMDDIYSLYVPTAAPDSQEPSNNELDELKRNFDLFEYMKQRNGTYRKINRGYMFENCEVCGHHDDLVYYEDTNSFYCFGANGGKGGTIIDYIMLSENIALNAAIDTLYELSGRERPQQNLERPNPRPRFSIRHLESYLESIGANLRYNEITHETEIKGFDTEYSHEQIDSILAILIFDRIRNNFRDCTMANIQNFIQAIIIKNRYNPVLDALNITLWDQRSRLPEIHHILGIEDDLSKVLVKKWFMQCVSLLHNSIDSPFGADGILVLTGDQGIGKTSFFKKLGEPYFREGAYIDFRDKDTIRRATGCFICELGEIESTLRSDIEKMKAFITRERDDYRLPYGRADVKHVRRTSFCGTCNSNEFLKDPTGNRRFWTVSVKNIDLDALSKLDVPQLWSEIYEMVKIEGLQAFRLKKDEQRLLNERNKAHEQPIRAQREVEDILSRIGNNSQYNWQLITVTEWKKQFVEIDKYSASDIGKALKKCGISPELKSIKSINGIKGRYHNLPTHINLFDQFRKHQGND